MKANLIRLLTAALFFTFYCPIASTADKIIGVYYFPGWKQQAPLMRVDPWTAIKRFPERTPLLGWYTDGDPAVAATHISWMAASGINLVVYDWYWVNQGPSLNHAIDAFISSPKSKLLQFSIIWANHTESPQSRDDFDAMVQYWIDNYFGKSNYFRVDGKPVVIIFSPSSLDAQARTFGASSKDLLTRARSAAADAGYPGIYFVGASQALASSVLRDLPNWSYDAITAYNYHQGLSGEMESENYSTSYKELLTGYSRSWNWIIGNSSLPYFLPLTAGWDKRPWGGTRGHPEHDLSFGNPSEFLTHLFSAKALLDEYPEKTLGVTLICCWNEFGEGSYIEPTKGFGYSYLDQIKHVFHPAR